MRGFSLVIDHSAEGTSSEGTLRLKYTTSELRLIKSRTP
jgi:hypothetical protein